jgi:hypothetical protein
MQLHKRTLANRAGKAAAPALSRLLVRPGTETLARTVEAYLCVLPGKGAGTGWARDAEISAASGLIRSADPVLFDVGANTGSWARGMRRFRPAPVTTIAIDDYVAEHAVRRVDFMKVDTEGHDLSVLRGARRALEDGTIRALSFEFGSGNVNSRTFFRDFWDLLTPCGYRLARVLPSGRLLSVRQYYEDCEYFRGVSNYVAAR